MLSLKAKARGFADTLANVLKMEPFTNENRFR